MNALTRFLDQIDQRRDLVVKERTRTRVCHACGDDVDVQEFDTSGLLYPSAHREALTEHFGALPCNDCLDTFAECEGCHDVSDDIHSTTWGERLCPSCEDQAQARRRF